MEVIWGKPFLLLLPSFLPPSLPYFLLTFLAEEGTPVLGLQTCTSWAPCDLLVPSATTFQS